MKQMSTPDFSFEKKLWQKGFKYVVGIDEVGRGAFAGPIVAAAVIFSASAELLDLGINDSKLLKPRVREKLTKEIKKYALAWDVTEVGVSVINRIGIGKATQRAMRKTIKDIAAKLDGDIDDKMFVLVDGFHVKYIPGIGLKKQKPIIGGDRKSISIAAASILAKVYRDSLMRRLGKNPRYKLYQWQKNKGYASEVHQRSIQRYGLTHYHRKQFVKTWREKKRRAS